MRAAQLLLPTAGPFGVQWCCLGRAGPALPQSTTPSRLPMLNLVRVREAMPPRVPRSQVLCERSLSMDVPLMLPLWYVYGTHRIENRSRNSSIRMDWSIDYRCVEVSSTGTGANALQTPWRSHQAPRGVVCGQADQATYRGACRQSGSVAYIGGRWFRVRGLGRAQRRLVRLDVRLRGAGRGAVRPGPHTDVRRLAACARDAVARRLGRLTPGARHRVAGRRGRAPTFGLWPCAS
jgi:hypothetical protein